MAWSDAGRMGDLDADALIRRATLAQVDGKLEEAEFLFRDAESLLTRALEQSESAGALDDDLPILLRELSRVCILQSAYNRAERPLLRLLAITEAQGDGRPEVATVLASLAAVRYALGDYTSAEQLYRQSLNIRERTLTPNHITTAATMESLAETCAARGSFAEAVSLRNRALSIREMTLGAADASVRMARKRIADLQLEAQEERRVSTPPGSLRALDATPPVEQPLMEQRPIIGASRLPAVLVPWADELAAVREEIESTSPAVRDDRAPRRSSLATALETRSSTTTIAVTVGVVVVLAALGFKSQLRDKPETNTFAEAEPFNPAAKAGMRSATAAVVPTLASPTPLDTVAIAAGSAVVATVSPPAAPPIVRPIAPPIAPRTTPPAVVARELPRPQAPTRSAPTASVAETPKRATAIAPSTSRPEVAAASRPVSPPVTPVIDSVPARVPAPAVEKPPETRPRSEPANAPTSPTLIGPAAQPQYPEALRAQQVEGDVVVQFVVDETGRPDLPSMTVVRSPHVLLTNAVRSVLPQLRYEPARTAPPQSAPRPETVRYAFTFRAPRR